jgi:hypothetical protein
MHVNGGKCNGIRIKPSRFLRTPELSKDTDPTFCVLDSLISLLVELYTGTSVAYAPTLISVLLKMRSENLSNRYNKSPF